MQYISTSLKHGDLDQCHPAPYVRKSFELPIFPNATTLQITTTGFYRLFINGHEVTKGPLSPYISNPNHVIYYDEYDINPFLKSGKNAIGIILGNGYTYPCFHTLGQEKATEDVPVKMALRIVATDDHRTYEINSDKSFKTAPSPITFNMYKYGIHYDARLEVEGWSTSEFDDHDWTNVYETDPPRGELKRCHAEPIVIREELQPVSIVRQSDFYYLHTSSFDNASPLFLTHIDDGWLYDFGVNKAGVCRLKIKGNKGQKITLRYCEKLRNGFFNMNSLYTLKQGYEKYVHLIQCDSYILKGTEEEIFIPFFTYHGFRYVFVEGVTEEQATNELLTYFVMGSNIPVRTDFSCSNNTLNLLYQMGINSDLSNFWYFPNDCPHREKAAWTGDASFSAEQMIQTLDCTNSMKVWMENIRYAQTDKGSIPAIVPDIEGWSFRYNGPVFDSVIVNIPYYCYKYDNRLDVFKENSDLILSYFSYVETKRDERGLIACSLGDWVQPGSIRLDKDASLEFVDSAIVLDMAQKAAALFASIGDFKNQSYCQGLSDSLRLSIRQYLLDGARMTIRKESQTSQALALALGIFTKDEYPIAYKRLLEFIHDKHDHVYCGLVGLRFIFHVLFENGDGDLACHMISRLDPPSYGNMIARGATALCESLEENCFNQSENHHFFGDILNLFISKIVGININPYLNLEKQVVIQPNFISSLDYAEGKMNTTRGTLAVKWRRVESGYCVDVSIPDDMVGKLLIGEQKKELPKGRSCWYLSQDILTRIEKW